MKLWENESLGLEMLFDGTCAEEGGQDCIDVAAGSKTQGLAFSNSGVLQADPEWHRPLDRGRGTRHLKSRLLVFIIYNEKKSMLLALPNEKS